MKEVFRQLLGALALAVMCTAQVSVLPLKDVKAGMRGAGKTVFSGDRIEDFQVEILGVLENIGPKQSLILARLSGGPMDKTGVLQGMSGSPVYIGGKLAGAVAMAFPFSKEPIAGIRPIEEMLRVSESKPAPARARVSLADTDLTAWLPRRTEAAFGASKMIDIATPVTFSGFTRGTIERFTPQLQALGLEPLQGVSSGGRMKLKMGDRSLLKPGSMISVQLVTGDMSIGADGTVTCIDGDKIYAFGHRFLSTGTTDLPFARAEVLTLLPTLASSFKISSPKELMGVISEDRSTVVAGHLGRRASMVPLLISVNRAGSSERSDYRMEMVNDRFLSPLLVQMTVFSALDATERTVGASSFAMKGEIEFPGGVPPVRLNNMYAADTGSVLQVSISAALPLAYVLQSGFQALQPKRIAIELESFNEKKQLQIDQVYSGRREVHPGDTIQLTVLLAGENGAELARKAEYHVPIGAPTGPLYFTVADALIMNMTEFRQVLGNTAKSPAQLVSMVNNLKPNTKAYIRVWRPEPAYQVEGEDFPSPPPSLALIFSTTQPKVSGLMQSLSSKLAELEINAGDYVVSGSKTIQVEVKE